MKITRISVENYRSFKGRQTLEIDGNISILVGPNGGGKSNLLDTALLLLRTQVFPSWVADRSQVNHLNPRPTFKRNDISLQGQMAPHREGQGQPQNYEIELEVTARDLENLETIVANTAQLQDALNNRYQGVTFPNLEHWKEYLPYSGQRFVVSNTYVKKEELYEKQRDTYLLFLQNFEWISRLQSEENSALLTTPILCLPANRSSAGVGFNVALADFTEHDTKKYVDVMSSKMPNGNVTTLATGRLADRYLEFLHRDEGKSMTRFMATEEAIGLTRGLASLGVDLHRKLTHLAA